MSRQDYQSLKGLLLCRKTEVEYEAVLKSFEKGNLEAIETGYVSAFID